MIMALFQYWLFPDYIFDAFQTQACGGPAPSTTAGPEPSTSEAPVPSTTEGKLFKKGI